MLVELELPWLMKEAALLKRHADPGRPPFPRILSDCGVGDYGVGQEAYIRGLRNLDKELRKAQ